MVPESMSLRIQLKHGPVLIPSLQKAGVAADCPLWNGITASEFYPSGVESAFYVLSLQKDVTVPDEVWKAEDELNRALEILATTWPFSGGSFLVLETRLMVTTPLYESNAKEVEAALLASAGIHRVRQHVAANYEVLATYRQPPLKIASQLASSACADPALRQLLRYHQLAWQEYYHHHRPDRSSWFIHLYKVRDLLSKIYKEDHAVRAALNISQSNWNFFGRVLNGDDLRHAELSDTAPPVPPHDINRLYKLAQGMDSGLSAEEGVAPYDLRERARLAFIQRRVMS